jgi:hypothetical protein
LPFFNGFFLSTFPLLTICSIFGVNAFLINFFLAMNLVLGTFLLPN